METKQILEKHRTHNYAIIFPASIKISFYGALYTWPPVQSMTTNDVCLLQPYLGTQQPIIHLAEEQRAERLLPHSYLHPRQSLGEIKCINWADGLSSEWGFKLYWCGANREAVCLLYTATLQLMPPGRQEEWLVSSRWFSPVEPQSFKAWLENWEL